MSINFQAPIIVRDFRNGSWFWVNTSVWRDKRLSQSDKIIYGTLASYSNQQQKAFPSIERIASDSGISKRHTYRCIKNLENAKYLQIIRRRGKANVYMLLKVSSSDKNGDVNNYTGGDIVSPVTKRHQGGDKKTLRTISNTKSNNNSKELLRKPSAYGNPLINFVLKEFEERWGYPPTDKKPRFEAYNLIRRINTYIRACGKEPTDEYVRRAVAFLLDKISHEDWAENIQTLGVIRRKMPIYLQPPKGGEMK